MDKEQLKKLAEDEMGGSLTITKNKNWKGFSSYRRINKNQDDEQKISSVSITKNK